MRVRQAKQALSIILLLAITSCATWDGQRYGGRGGRTHRIGEDRQAPVEKEVKRPDSAQMASASSPARSASMEMVAKGKSYLENHKFDKALSVFQEAVVVDSTNGIAYYYIAKTRFYLGQYEEALGILDKAEALLGSSSEWAEAISMLKTQIQASYLSNGESEDNDRIPIINKKDDT